MTEPTIQRVRLAAPIQAVRHALTDAASLRVWLAEYAEVDLPRTYAFWGRYTPEGDAPHQRLLHVDDTTLRFDWLLDGEDTTVHIELQQERPDSTILTLSLVPLRHAGGDGRDHHPRRPVHLLGTQPGQSGRLPGRPRTHRPV